MLQAYALQQVLLSWGYCNEIINLRTKVQRGLILPPLQWCHPRSSLLRLVREPDQTLALQRKYRRFEAFLRKDLQLTRALDTHEQVEQYLIKHQYDVLIAGSDQIWNPGCWDFDRSYLLDFSLPWRRVAYAPSLGSAPEKIPTDKLEDMRAAWSRFDSLSTREARGSAFVAQQTGRKVEVVLDPTLLLEKDKYLPLIQGKRLVDEPYIFYYTPREESGTFRMAQMLARQMGYKIVVTQSHPEYEGDNLIRIYDCGPREFLNVVHHASYTIGKSFHLLAFSLIFEKEFLMVSRELDSRMTNILDALGICGRIVSPDSPGVCPLPQEIDYRKVKERFAQIRQSSLDYLRMALEAK